MREAQVDGEGQTSRHHGWDDPELRRLRQIAEAVCTPRELQVLRRRADGLGYKLIGRDLGVCRDTIRVLWKRANRKIRAEAATIRNVNP